MKLADRIKKYEAVTRYYATSKMPLMIRVDGKAFHTFTKDFEKPFDQKFINTMVSSAKAVAKEMQGFKVAYHQSDEVTFCITDYDNIESEGWFNYNLSKIISVSSSLMTVHFNKLLKTNSTPIFDSRAFSIPEIDVVNAFLWRAKDWERNSLQMYARTLFSHKELHGKSKNDIHDMLHNIGLNWTKDITEQHRNGTFLIKNNEDKIEERCNIKPTFDLINSNIGHLFKYDKKNSAN